MDTGAIETATAELFQSDAASPASFAQRDGLSREVYCILGIPVDAIQMRAALTQIEAAAAGRTPFLISTVNINFLVNSQFDTAFRESLILSDLCTADGMLIIWIAWLIGIPIKKRIAGSDIFDALKVEHSSAHPIKTFLFGGPDGVATAASRALNAQPRGLYCVGSFYPGFCSVDEISRDEIIENVNSSGADFLVVSLGAQKGQLWLQRNHHQLLIPVRAHLGASLNFQAGTVRRAPPMMRKFGLEWLWRIKEEPYLWRRYWSDGRVLLRLLLTHILPFVFCKWWLHLNCERADQDLTITQTYSHESVIVSLSGHANAQNVDRAIPAFRAAIAANKRVTLDFSNTLTIDPRFLGLILMLQKKLKSNGATITSLGLSLGLQRIFRLSGLEFVHTTTNASNFNSSRLQSGPSAVQLGG